MCTLARKDVTSAFVTGIERTVYWQPLLKYSPAPTKMWIMNGTMGMPWVALIYLNSYNAAILGSSAVMHMVIRCQRGLYFNHRRPQHFWFRPQLREVDELLREILATKVNRVGGDGLHSNVAHVPLVGLMDTDPAELPQEMKLQLLRRLRCWSAW